MTRLMESGGVLIDGSASELAFEAGQILERELTKKAVILAKNQADAQHNIVVTADHIRASFNASLLDEIRIRLGVGPHGESGEQRRVSA